MSDSGGLERYRGVKGLYLLVIGLEEGDYRVGRLYEGKLPDGFYVYIGSAWGSGGLGARLSRHLVRSKKVHWHIDWITSDPRSRVSSVYILPGVKGESDLYNIVSSIGGCIIPGFGSSDDPGSRCHLLYLKTDLDVLEGILSEFYPNYIKILL
ncbi:MAG: GIY-YIG nuclease family protein [Desulfurococcales archaeon]|nr:GIY-YIG nuclease family protein [Desulfurococcales archaeon]